MIKISNMKTSYAYGEPFLVDAASFHKGELTAIIGKNGCGKTTLLKTLAGLMPYSGSIRIEDRECSAYKRRERAMKVSYLPQIVKPVRMDVQTLVEHGRFPWCGSFRTLSEEDKRQVELAIAHTQLDAYRRRALGELSGGELRRAYLAMVIAQNADMMLLDEPTTYMDVESQTLFFEIVKELTERGIGVVMTCHNIEQSFAKSDRILVMHARAARGLKTPDELIKEEALLREAFGVSVKKSEIEALLYPYVLIK